MGNPKPPRPGTASAVWLSPADLHPNPKNPRVHGADVGRLARTILRTTWGAPIIAQASTRRIIGGHGRLEAAKLILAGIEVDGQHRGGPGHTFATDAPGPGVVPVRLVDVSDAEADAMTLADNAKSLQGIDDAEAIVAMATAAFERGAPVLVDLGIGLDAEELDRIAREAASAAPVGARDPSGSGDGEEFNRLTGTEADAAADSKPGAVYELGPHRLVCGDSRKHDVWLDLLRGEKLDLVWTDPPYGVNVAGGSKDARNVNFASGDTIANDDLSPEQLGPFLRAAFAQAFAATKDGGAWYVAAPAGLPFGVFGAELTALEMWRHTLVWVKQSFVFGRSDYHYRHEAIFYGWKPGAAHYFVDDRTQDSVFEIDRPTRSPEHPTMKPVALVRRMVENSSRVGEIVGDPFGGSGTTLLACAESGRVARLIEFAPRYCDAIRRRWTRYALDVGIDPGPGALSC